MPGKGRRAPTPKRSDLSREQYAIEYLAKKFGLSEDQAKDLIDEHGADLVKLKDAAKKLAD
jgi:hypothetical protein